MANNMAGIAKFLGPNAKKLAGAALVGWIGRPENQTKALNMVQGLASSNPTQKLLSQIDLAIVAFEEIATNTAKDSDRFQLAETTLDELRTLRTRLQLPFPSAKARRENRKNVKVRFNELLAAANESL